MDRRSYEELMQLMQERIESLNVELGNQLAANREEDIKLILLELMAGRRSTAADLPADVLRDLASLMEKSIKAVSEHLEKLICLKMEGSPAAAAPPSPVEEAHEPPPVVTEVFVALQEEGAPPLGILAVAPPASPAPGGEPRD